MKQPKFKLGDRLTDTREESMIIVRKITHWHDTFIYSDGISTIPEKCAELCDEPQKKKLHAHTVKVHTIGGGYFFEYKFIHPGTPTPSEWSRAPDYDIEYPEAE